MSAFGYEGEDGSVHYSCTRGYTLDELFTIMSTRKVPTSTPIHHKTLSLEDYFSEDLYIKENTIWRVLFLLDGTVLCRHVSKRGDILYRQSRF